MMKTHNASIYPYLEAQIAQRGIRKGSIANAIGVTATSLTNKLHGKTQFTWSQVKTIQATFFPDLSKEQLFASEGSDTG